MRFGSAVAAAELQYVEEPTADPLQGEAFFLRTRVPVALDETVDLAARGDTAAAHALTVRAPGTWRKTRLHHGWNFPVGF